MQPEPTKNLFATVVVTARAFRLGMTAEGNDGIVGFVDRWTALGLDGAVALRFAPILSEVVQAQGRRDYLRVADLLEFEVLPALEGLGAR